MKPLLVAVLVAAACAAQTDADIHADRISRGGAITRASGHVVIKVDNLVLSGDEGTYHSDTGEVEVRGNATVLLPARADRHVFRYDTTKAVVTGEEVALSADTLNVKNSLLRGRGHVSIRTDRARLQSDEMFLYLRIGDAEVRGNVLLNGGPPEPAPSSFDRLMHRRTIFPPDIMK